MTFKFGDCRYLLLYNHFQLLLYILLLTFNLRSIFTILYCFRLMTT